jgi:hypothetical protein
MLHGQACQSRSQLGEGRVRELCRDPALHESAADRGDLESQLRDRWRCSWNGIAREKIELINLDDGLEKLAICFGEVGINTTYLPVYDKLEILLYERLREGVVDLESKLLLERCHNLELQGSRLVSRLLSVDKLEGMS